MPSKNEYFNPFMEGLRAAMENAGNLMAHPIQQSQNAYGAARDMLSNQASAMQQASPLQPFMRPGVPEEAMTPEQIDMMKRKQMGGLLGE